MSGRFRHRHRHAKLLRGGEVRFPFVSVMGTENAMLAATLAEGTFHVNGCLFRYTTHSAYDKWANAATFFVGGAPEVRGSVNLKPRLLALEVAPKTDPSMLSDAMLSASD